jgi:hypothetical protein
MGAADKEDKIDSGSQFGKKGACQWNHSGQLSGWLATPAEHVCLSDALQFLIANPELEFNLSPKRISKLRISNRKYMTIFHSENWATSELRRLPQANCWKKSARSPRFLIATVTISEKDSTCRKQTSKQISNSNKNAFSAFSQLLDATRVTGSSHAGSPHD